MADGAKVPLSSDFRQVLASLRLVQMEASKTQNMLRGLPASRGINVGNPALPGVQRTYLPGSKAEALRSNLAFKPSPGSIAAQQLGAKSAAGINPNAVGAAALMAQSPLAGGGIPPASGTARMRSSLLVATRWSC